MKSGQELHLQLASRLITDRTLNKEFENNKIIKIKQKLRKKLLLHACQDYDVQIEIPNELDLKFSFEFTCLVANPT